MSTIRQTCLLSHLLNVPLPLFSPLLKSLLPPLPSLPYVPLSHLSSLKSFLPPLLSLPLLRPFFSHFLLACLSSSSPLLYYVSPHPFLLHLLRLSSVPLPRFSSPSLPEMSIAMSRLLRWPCSCIFQDSIIIFVPWVAFRGSAIFSMCRHSPFQVKKQSDRGTRRTSRKTVILMKTSCESITTVSLYKTKTQAIRLQKKTAPNVASQRRKGGSLTKD